MADTRFRPTLYSLDRRDVPASGITPEQVFSAAGFAQQMPGILTYLDENFEQSKAGGAGPTLLTAADNSRANVTVLNKFLNDISEVLTTNPGAAGQLGELSAWATGLIAQSTAVAASSEALAARLGTSRPVPPPPPPTGVGGSQIGSNDDQNPPTSPPVTPSPPVTAPPSDGSQLTRTIPNLADSGFVAVGSQGLRVRDVVVGSGDTATSTSRVQVRYIGFLESNGTSFDNNIGSGQPLSATLGPTPTVIQGFAQGVAGMRVGGIRDIQIPAALGYGAAGAGASIPPNSNLVFEVQLLSVA